MRRSIEVNIGRERERNEGERDEVIGGGRKEQSDRRREKEAK